MDDGSPQRDLLQRRVTDDHFSAHSVPLSLTWRDVSAKFARKHGLEEEFLDVLDAFRSPWPRGGPAPRPETPFQGTFGELEARVTAPLPSEGELAATVGREVDEEQARMFGRRILAVDQRLSSALDPAARLLRVGYRVRLGGILAGPTPRALRLRALADFYYSQLGLLLYRDQLAEGKTLQELVSALRWRQEASGLEYTVMEGNSRSGPLHVGLMRLDMSRVRIEVRDLRRQTARGQPFLKTVEESGALAGTSGGFFLYSESDIAPPSKRFDPVGLLVSGGEVLNPPTHRRGGLLIGPGGTPAIQQIGPEGLAMRVGGRRIVAECTMNRAQGEWGPAEPSIAIVGTRVLEVGEQLPVPLNGFVCRLPEGARVRKGDRVEFLLPIIEGIAGGPMLVENGRPAIDLRSEDFWGGAPPQTFSQDETGDRNLLPRLAVGLDSQGRLLLAAVDGRNFQRALGMTLAGTAELMVALGCQRACNLDGGSSKRMVVAGRELDLATTEVVSDGSRPKKVRPVHTGLLVFGR